MTVPHTTKNDSVADSAIIEGAILKSRLRIRFSLKVLLIVLSLACVIAGIRTISVNERMLAIARLERDNTIFSDHRFDFAGPDSLWLRFADSFSFSPASLRGFFGQWVCADAYSRAQANPAKIDSQTIDDLISLPELRWVAIVTSREVSIDPTKLSQLDSVAYLELGGEWVTNEHLSALKECPQLEWLVLYGTSVGENDVAQLREERPSMDIYVGTENDLQSWISRFQSKD